MRIVARVLGQLLLALAALWGLFAVGLVVKGDGNGALGSAVLAGLFAIPGALLRSYALTADRRLQAEAMVQHRDRFSVEEVARALGTTAEQAHVFIAAQISRLGLDLRYQPEARAFARQALAPPPPPPPQPVSAQGPCPMCGSTAPATEQGFCPTCGARAERPPVRA